MEYKSSLRSPELGHNQPSFDEVVQESLARRLLLTIKDAYTMLSRDPRAEKRHFRVLAEIIDCLNFNDVDGCGEGRFSGGEHCWQWVRYS
jgi:hypothetical protein